jgi:TetR/AcrR family transcriptional regulator, regulator of cefoperazone and chloramphenicol sensitivity
MDKDLETRQRLIETAAMLFSQRGFNNVTVREICAEAQANVAAVNYHFRDKFGLYTQVVRTAIEAMRGTSAAAKEAGAGGSAEEKLRTYIRIFLQRVVVNGRDSWIHRLMNHEMADPTPALDLIVDEAIRPRLEYLGGVVAELLGCAPNDDRVMKCVASVQSQCLLSMRNAAAERLYPRLKLTPPTIHQLADHISEFSLAGIRALARRSVVAASSPGAARRRRASTKRPDRPGRVRL